MKFNHNTKASWIVQQIFKKNVARTMLAGVIFELGSTRVYN